MNYSLKAPVLLIAFNRPDTTKKAFQKIREAKPHKLYVATDGPRRHVPSDIGLVKEVQKIVREVDWPCKVYYYFNKSNKGAEVTISSAISWVLDNEESVIILEDDIIAPISFFRFAQQMLRKYADRDEIVSVSGSNFTPIDEISGPDYFFSKFGHTGGGWATWKRAWKGFNLNIQIPKEHCNKSFLSKVCNTSSEIKFYQKKFKKMRERGVGGNTWDNVEQYRRRVGSKLSIVPKVNLTSNIGVYGLHSNGRNEHHFMPYDDNFVINKHPKKIECNTNYDVHHFENYINKRTPLWIRVKKKLKRITFGK